MLIKVSIIIYSSSSQKSNSRSKLAKKIMSRFLYFGLGICICILLDITIQRKKLN